MTKLTVANFSCIESADIELGDLTILIGPQASGKSVLSKLIYFANDVLNNQYDHIEDEKGIDALVRALEQNFLKLFPAMAWGKGKFNIRFEAGPYHVEVTRKGTQDRIRVQFSDFFVARYERFLESWTKQKQKVSEKEKRHVPEFQLYWRAKSADQKALASEMGQEYFQYQLFIPAGRSFFTSVGKAIAVFEHSGILDPITVEFGRFFAALRERHGQRYFTDDDSRISPSRRKELMQQFFGGSIEFGRDEEFIKTPDGRKVPFAVLSSGQQELLPLWMVVDEISHFRDLSSLIFIEEPEAHLFPSAQADITNYLASIAADRKRKQKVLITTHSPYVLANINNLMKAGSLGESLPQQAKTEIAKIVPKSSWLIQERVRAFALKDGTTESICSDGLIIAEYLDEVSGEIAAKFSSLLEIEGRQWESQNASNSQTTPA
jgi:predicted ATPase